jgi:hypothetical protein
MGAFFFFGEAFDAAAVLRVIAFLSGRCSDTDSAFEAAYLDLGFEAVAGKVAAPTFDSLSGAPSLCFSHSTILGVNCF